MPGVFAAQEQRELSCCVALATQQAGSCLQSTATPALPRPGYLGCLGRRCPGCGPALGRRPNRRQCGTRVGRHDRRSVSVSNRPTMAGCPVRPERGTAADRTSPSGSALSSAAMSGSVGTGTSLLLHASQPSVRCRANGSMRLRSGYMRSMVSRADAGLTLCCRRSASITESRRLEGSGVSGLPWGAISRCSWLCRA